MNDPHSGPSKRPLKGIKIVEYATFHAGPGATAILSDLGAEVVKIEQPSADPERSWTSVGDFDLSLGNGESIFFEISNRNKMGICLDIKNDKGRRVFERLIQDADVFLCNLRKSTRTKLRLDYQTLSQVNPKIIYSAVSGYGREGPMADLGAFDPLGMAHSGMLFVTGSEEPRMMHLAILDQATAITLSHGILTALFVREREGIGQEIHVSLYSAALWVQYTNLMIANAFSREPRVSDDPSYHSPLRNRFLCKDGKWILGAHHPEEKHWANFCKATGRPDLVEDSYFTNARGEPQKYVELNAIYDKIFLSKTSEEWMTIFGAHGLMFCVVRHIGEAQRDPQALANGFFTPCDHPVLGRMNLPAYPVQFSVSQAGTRCAAPKLGEHTDQVLGKIGYSAEEIHRLRKEGVVR